MKNSIGDKIKITYFGESHSPEMGAIISGIEDIEIDEDFMRLCLQRRKPSGASATPRHEDDIPLLKRENGVTVITLKNVNVKPEDYENTIPRPSHADYPAFVRFGKIPSGGGIYSGRMTAVTVAAGSIFLNELRKKGIHIATHILNIHGVCDRSISADDIPSLENEAFPVIDSDVKREMIKEIENVSSRGDSLGGIAETVITGLPVGLGEPILDSIESVVSHLVFSIPSVKGIEFGDGFGYALETGSEANDGYYIENGKVTLKTNHQGGISGGMANGAPVVFRTAFKPVPTVKTAGDTVDLKTMTPCRHTFGGRHDGCIMPRVAVVLDCAAATAIYQLLSEM